MKMKKCDLYFRILLILSTVVLCMLVSIANAEKPTDLKSTLEQLPINIDTRHINILDSSGKKNGLWIEENEYYILLTYYVADVKNGLEQIYIKRQCKAILHQIIDYRNGNMQSILIFHSNGMPISFISDLKNNDWTENYPTNWIAGQKFPYIGYTKDFDEKTGAIIAEGFMIFGDDWEIDCERVGEWKIYDHQGNFVVENYGGLGIKKE